LFNTKCDAVVHRTAQRAEVLDALKSRGVRGRFALFEIHPEIGTGIDQFGYSGFKESFFFWVRQPVYA
jgi:hypothetical protein